MTAWFQAYEHLIANTCVYAIAAMALYFTLRAGVFNLSTAGVMAIGAYGTGVLMVKHGWSIAPALVGGTCIGTVGGAVVALPVIRLRGHFLAIATLAFAAVVEILATTEGGLTGGPAGLVGITANISVWVLLVLVAIVVYVAFAVRRRRVGRAWDAVRVDEAAAAAAGVDVVRYKLLAFLMSTVLAALAGGLFALVNFVLVPNLFGFSLLTNVLVYTLLGGIGNPLGPVAGTAIVATMPTWLSAAGPYLDIVTGALLIIVVTYAPGGLVQLGSLVGRLAGGGRRRRPMTSAPAPSPVVQAAASSARVAASAPRQTDACLRIRDLAKHYGGVRSVDGVSFEVRAGETVALIGPNGAGKTTLLNCISGLVRPTRGTIELDGARIERWPAHAVAVRARIRRTFQTPRVLPGMTVTENVLLGLHADISGGVVAAATRWPGSRASERRAAEHVRRALEEVGLGGMGETVASDLAYGLQRRVELARALVAEPAILLLDEPVAGLSQTEADELRDILRDVARTSGCAVVFVDHNMPFVVGLAERIVVLHFGRLLATGTPAEIQANAEVVEAYLGDAATAVAP